MMIKTFLQFSAETFHQTYIAIKASKQSLLYQFHSLLSALVEKISDNMSHTVFTNNQFFNSFPLPDHLEGYPLSNLPKSSLLPLLPQYQMNKLDQSCFGSLFQSAC